MAEERITIEKAAKQMNVCQQFVRIGLQRGVLPFGVALKMSNNYTYYIYPEKFKEYIGKTKEDEAEQ